MCLIQVLLDRMGEAPPKKVPKLSLILLELRTSRVKVGLVPMVTLGMGNCSPSSWLA